MVCTAATNIILLYKFCIDIFDFIARPEVKNKMVPLKMRNHTFVVCLRCTWNEKSTSMSTYINCYNLTAGYLPVSRWQNSNFTFVFIALYRATAEAPWPWNEIREETFWSAWWVTAWRAALSNRLFPTCTPEYRSTPNGSTSPPRSSYNDVNDDSNINDDNKYNRDSTVFEHTNV